MSKTERSKVLLRQALSNLPEDFALREVRFYLSQAISKLESVEKKRVSRQEAQEKRKEMLLGNNFLSVQQTLDTLDDMLEAENQKLEEIKSKKTRRESNDETILG